MLVRANITKVLVLVAAVAVFLTVAGTALILMFDHAAFMSWISTLVATFVGAVLALAVGIGLFNYQAGETDRKRQSQLLEALAAELQANLDLLRSGRLHLIEAGDKEWKLALVHLQPLIIEEAVRSGVFDSEDTHKFIHLERAIRSYNADVSYVLNMRSVLLHRRAYEHVVKGLIEQQKWITEACESMLESLERRGLRMQFESPFE